MENTDDLIVVISELIREQFPNVSFSLENDNLMVIEQELKNGFKIIIAQGEIENTLYLGSWHMHFEKDIDGKNELVDYLHFGMSRLGRVKAFARKGKEYKWVFETKNIEDGLWYPVGTMGLINLKFWQKTQIEYYQNDFIPLEQN
ncbi:MAG: hypothetical protein ED557_10255 [Balneola sp.]|nr:MAG: hypothetical protein ED557_10255 [Balneola sp.]